MAWADDNQLIQYFANEQVVIGHGRALYPRFYLSHEGEGSGEYWQAFQDRDYNRLGFILVGSGPAQIVLPIDDAPEYFPHASDAVVIGCRMGDYVEALAVIIQENDNNHLIVRSPVIDLTCPYEGK